MFRLGICGDSWMSPATSDQYSNTHFSQLLCKEQNWHLEWYARPGSSNGGICLQLEQAMHDKCDLILFGTTTYNRTEYGLGNMLNTDPSHLWEGCNEITIQNVAPPSHKYKDQQNTYQIVSDNIVGVLNYKTSFIDYEKIYTNTPNEYIELKYQAFKDWFMNLYHPAWKQKLDRWCLHAVLQKIRESNIPIECVIDFVGMPDTYWIGQPVLGKEWLQDYVGPDNGPTYHTTPEDQIRIMNMVKDRLKNKGISLD